MQIISKDEDILLEIQPMSQAPGQSHLDQIGRGRVKGEVGNAGY